MPSSRLSLFVVCGLLVLHLTGFASDSRAAEPAKEAAKDTGIALSDGRLLLKPAKGWLRKKPRNRIVEYEFAAPAVEGDKLDGRVTIMGAGGSVEANIDRWIAQFTQPDRKSTRDRGTFKETKVAGQTVHLVDLSGTFRDQLGPFAPATMRDNYRMLGAIIVTEKMGRYFLKLYGPKATVAANEKAFLAVVESLQVRPGK